jgi:hypothetical protein
MIMSLQRRLAPQLGQNLMFEETSSSQELHNIAFLIVCDPR